MSEYFIKTITRTGTGASGEMYSKYLKDTIGYVTDYKRIREKSKRYFRDVKERLEAAMEDEAGPEQRYLERMLSVLDWLQDNPTFYNYYFKEYYSCPNCGASIFEHFNRQMVGDWLMITCSKCDTLIKKYFLPKQV